DNRLHNRLKIIARTANFESVRTIEDLSRPMIVSLGHLALDPLQGPSRSLQ
ncbi:unnamed protein product, partial [Arabidopsis halleri]